MYFYQSLIGDEPEGTVFPNDDFDAEAAAEQLREAMEGFGTDEQPIIDIMKSHSNEQRQEIKTTYKTAYGKELEEDLEGELKGKFENVVLALMTAPRLYEARQLRNAMKGGGTDEATLIEILCTRNNDEITDIKEAYKQEFDRDLEEDVKSDTSGNFERLLVSQLTGARETNEEYDEDLAEADAQELFDAGEGQLGTDESVFNKILSLRSYPQLRETFAKYMVKSEGKDIEEVVKSETSGTLQDGYLAIVQVAKDLQGFFAHRLYKSMKGLGTDDDTLIRIVVSRSEIDLQDIKAVFKDKYETSLAEFIEDDCNGDYKAMLIGIVGEN